MTTDSQERFLAAKARHDDPRAARPALHGLPEPRPASRCCSSSTAAMAPRQMLIAVWNGRTNYENLPPTDMVDELGAPSVRS